MGKLIKFPSKEKREERTPLHVDHLDGRIKGQPHYKRSSSKDFRTTENRIDSICKSFEKISSLMAELEKQKGRRDYDR